MTRISSADVRRVRSAELERLIEIDDAASVLYAEAGFELALPSNHPFVVAERERWRAALARGSVYGVDQEGDLRGFAVLGSCDGAAYLDQLSVHPAFMRRGIGTRLLEYVIARCAGPLWLTTYSHLPWNRPYYERFAFVESAAHGPELGLLIDEQRAALPAPHKRIAMVRNPRERLGIPARKRVD